MTPAEIRKALTEVRDPEIPVLNIVEMGIVRDVRLEGDTVHVEITPTYTGCPAMRTIEESIVQTLRGRGFQKVIVHKVFREPWTTDWMTDEAREKLRAYGIAPPPPRADDAPDLIPLPFSVARGPTVPCPFCGSEQTRQTSAFGSTACKALFFCEACRQPFEYFKAI
ncbi:1,2-phenylacetyl-CoA epoxidase subunit PaaD [Rhodothermus marinus]|uniref:Phenylacetate-CoA oxygenase, PaaJ subunit n=1 Tax=Rhodothermus marinus (strain ATCC 43812 / DSM 4252 / R-10) TaxID=518766 RepID=D0MIX5_RHOM4|nr:1,2-phenylacetyl-CoA epoxidase subunit PaaD [Rhodothermus marinus]ACY48433.1 phenylacetate-CoA oxygenase, PaaJ subunit [Rhodothermus marinus DSM 4252]